MVSHFDFGCISWMINDVARLFVGLLAICISSLKKYIQFWCFFLSIFLTRLFVPLVL